MDLGLKDKVALVLGAGGGLGSAIALTLAKEGARVALADIDAAALERVIAEINAAGGKAVPFDLADRAAMDARVTGIEAAYGSIDVLVNNTGGPPPTPASGQDPALWTKHFQSMVLSVIAITDRVLPGMRERKWGRIVTSTGGADRKSWNFKCAAIISRWLVKD